jgi:uncharacterized membrane protein (UPF0127 family)
MRRDRGTKSIRVVNTTRDSVLGSSVAVADSWWTRVRGFLGRPAPEHGEGLLLSPCRAVHMVGMSYALDIVFVGRTGEVIAAYSELKPLRRTKYHAKAEYALEVPAGTIHATHTQAGDQLTWSPADAPAPIRTTADSAD